MLKLFNDKENSKGISLVEVIIAMAIGLIGALGSYSLFASVHGTRAENLAVVQAQQEARNVMERITRELRESSPEVVWPDYEDGVESSRVYFLTPRNADREFIINDQGEPEWQRGIYYWLNSNTHTLYRHQFYLNFDPESGDWSSWFNFEIVSENVERLSFSRSNELNFSRTNDMITINIRTFADNTNKIGQTADSYADLQTTIKLRN